MAVKEIKKFKVQLTRDTRVQGDSYDVGDILDVEYKDLINLKLSNCAIELKEQETVKETSKKKK